MKHEEDALQTFLIALFPHVLKPEVLFFHVPNGGLRNLREASRLKGMGVLAGVADIVLVFGGLAYFLELKSSKGRQSPRQKDFEGLSLNAGAPYEIAKNGKEAYAVLRKWGLLKKGVKANVFGT